MILTEGQRYARTTVTGAIYTHCCCRTSSQKNLKFVCVLFFDSDLMTGRQDCAKRMRPVSIKIPRQYIQQYVRSNSKIAYEVYPATADGTLFQTRDARFSRSSWTSSTTQYVSYLGYLIPGRQFASLKTQTQITRT